MLTAPGCCGRAATTASGASTPSGRRPSRATARSTSGSHARSAPTSAPRRRQGHAKRCFQRRQASQAWPPERTACPHRCTHERMKMAICSDIRVQAGPLEPPAGAKPAWLSGSGVPGRSPERKSSSPGSSPPNLPYVLGRSRPVPGRRGGLDGNDLSLQALAGGRLAGRPTRVPDDGAGLEAGRSDPARPSPRSGLVESRGRRGRADSRRHQGDDGNEAGERSTFAHFLTPWE